MKKPLSYFRHMTRQNIAKLDGMKSIMRVETPRTVSWWLVLPAHNDEDGTCVLISKAPKRELTANIEKQIIADYADRITA